MTDTITFWILAACFWLSAGIIFYSYVVFPLILSLLSTNKKLTLKQYSKNDDLPFVSILISAFNEAAVIENKIHSIFETSYPPEKIEVLVGSDASTDNTDAIIKKLLKQYPRLKFFPFTERRGKGNVINDLFEKANGEILLLTDANVILEKNTIFELVKYFKDETVGLTDSRMINTNIKKDGISYQERAYITREVYIKHNESLLWGTMMGPFGGCFAIRKKLYPKVPPNFLVDDFYINMKILEKSFKCINNLDAKVYENVPNKLSDEFRRKIRIATGNFQNLRAFYKLLAHNKKGLAFSFISHKILRWLGPFFIILAFISNLILALYNDLYFYLFIIHCILIILPLIDYFLKKLNFNINILRFITHFYSMNIALLTGFFKSFKSIKTNVWKPTKRS